MYTFVSGLETLYVAGRVILLHSHLLPQRLGSHPIDNAIANLQRHTCYIPGSLPVRMHAGPCHLLFPAWLYLFCLLSEVVVHRLWVDAFPLGSDAAKHVCSPIQHLATRVISLAVYWCLLYDGGFFFFFFAIRRASKPLTCRRRWSLERWANTLNSSWE